MPQHIQETTRQHNILLHVNVVASCFCLAALIHLSAVDLKEY